MLILRFILNFFLFGLLFYIIYVFFPEAFHTLVSWADRTYEFLKNLFTTNMERRGPPNPEEGVNRALFLFLPLWTVAVKNFSWK